MSIEDHLVNAVPEHALKGLHQELVNGWELKKVKAAHQARWAAANRGEAKTVEGLGQLMASIPPDSYHFWGQKLGYECWKDEGFLNEFLRDNPECRVKSTSHKATVSVNGFKGLVDQFGKPL